MTLSVLEFAPAKINLALHVLGRRDDGYHELDSVVAFASVGDVLEVSLNEATTLRVDGPFASGVPISSDNLVLRAYEALSQETRVPPVAMRLTKNLPVASGIGGGSADAAAALRGILKLADVSMEPEKFHRIALSLGADVPVCLYGKACRMQGVGEIITRLDQLPAKAIVLVNPLQPCGTAEVFRGMGLKAGEGTGSALDVNTPSDWRNDMTTAAVAVLPEIENVLNTLRRHTTGEPVRMSGSGATCFALFDSIDRAEAAATELTSFNNGWWIAPALLT